MNRIKIGKADTVLKGWGKETVIHNADGYCVKLLHFNGKSKGSFHFHLIKVETWFVLKGAIHVTSVHPENGRECYFTILEGQTVHLPAGVAHRVESLMESVIVEGSTPHSDDDVYRIAPGDSQK